MTEQEESKLQPIDFQPAEGPLDQLKNRIFDVVAGSRLPNKNYPSTVVTFGSYVDYDRDGNLVWSTKGVMPTIDRVGDWFLRQFDDHIAKDPLEFIRHGKYREFFTLLLPGPKRKRANAAETLDNIHRLGLDEYYGPHPLGIQIKKPEVFEYGIALQDIWRQDVLKTPVLEDIDRFDALKTSVQYVKAIHTRSHGGIGEVLPSDVLFLKQDDGTLTPVLGIPDIVYTRDGKGELKTTPTEQKALDLLNLLFSIPVEELRRSPDSSLQFGDNSPIERVISTIITSYNDPSEETQHILKTVCSFAKRGRVTLAGDEEMLPYPKKGSITKNDKGLTRIHNRATYRIEEINALPFRTMIIKAINAVIPPSPSQIQP